MDLLKKRNQRHDKNFITNKLLNYRYEWDRMNSTNSYKITCTYLYDFKIIANIMINKQMVLKCLFFFTIPKNTAVDLFDKIIRTNTNCLAKWSNRNQQI